MLWYNRNDSIPCACALAEGANTVLDKHLMEQMESTLARLTIPVAVLDKEYDVRPHVELKGLDNGMVMSVDGSLYLAVEKPSVVLTCPADVW